MSKRADIATLTREELIDEVTQLKHQVALLRKLVFGPRSDRFKLAEVPVNQLSLGVSSEPLAEVEVKKTTIKEHDRTSTKLKARSIPAVILCLRLCAEKRLSSSRPKM